MNKLPKLSVYSSKKQLYSIITFLILLIVTYGCNNNKVENKEQEVKLFNYTSRYEVQMEILGKGFYTAIEDCIKEQYPQWILNGILLNEKQRTDEAERKLLNLEKQILQPLRKTEWEGDDLFELRKNRIQSTGLEDYKNMLDSSLGNSILVSADLTLGKKKQVVFLFLQKFKKIEGNSYWKATLSTPEQLEQLNKKPDKNTTNKKDEENEENKDYEQ